MSSLTPNISAFLPPLKCATRTRATIKLGCPNIVKPREVLLVQFMPNGRIVKGIVEGGWPRPPLQVLLVSQLGFVDVVCFAGYLSCIGFENTSILFQVSVVVQATSTILPENCIVQIGAVTSNATLTAHCPPRCACLFRCCEP